MSEAQFTINSYAGGLQLTIPRSELPPLCQWADEADVGGETYRLNSEVTVQLVEEYNIIYCKIIFNRRFNPLYVKKISLDSARRQSLERVYAMDPELIDEKYSLSYFT